MTRFAAALRSPRTWWAAASGVLALGFLALDLDALRPGRSERADALRTVNAARGSLEVTAAATGTFQPLIFVDVGAQLSGQLKSVSVNAGDAVRRGQLVAEIDDATARARLAQNEASLASVRAQAAAKHAQIELARVQRDRNLRLVEYGFLSVATLDIAEATLAGLDAEADSLLAQASSLTAVIEQARAELRYAKVRAPIDGTVVALLARPGQALNAAQQVPTILRIADLESMVLIAQVSEADVVHVRPGMEARFNLLGVADRNFAGRVRQVLPWPNVINGVVFYDVLVEPAKPEDLFRIGMTAQIYFLFARHECVLKIPRVALPADLKPPRRLRLAVLGPDRKPHPTEIEITAVNDTEVGISCAAAERAGLADGAEIVMPASATEKSKKR